MSSSSSSSSSCIRQKVHKVVGAKAHTCLCRGSMPAQRHVQTLQGHFKHFNHFALLLFYASNITEKLVTTITAPLTIWQPGSFRLSGSLVNIRARLTVRCPSGYLGPSDFKGTVPARKRSSNLLKRLQKIFAMPVRPRSATEIRYNIIFPP